MLLQSTIMFMQISLAPVMATLAASIAVIGAALGIGKIGTAAMEAIARQPEAAGNVRTTAIIIAALIEGAALFAIVVCFMALSK